MLGDEKSTTIVCGSAVWRDRRTISVNRKSRDMFLCSGDLVYGEC